MGFPILGAPPKAPATTGNAPPPSKPVGNPAASPPKAPKDAHVDPKHVASHPSDVKTVGFDLSQADANRFGRLANHFGSFSSPEKALQRAMGDLLPLFAAGKGKGGISLQKGDFKVAVQGNTMTVTKKNPKCEIVLVRHRDGGIHVEGKGSFQATSAKFSGYWRKGSLSIGEMKASYKGIGAVHRGNVAGLPPCAVSFGSLAPDVQAKYKPVLEALGVDSKAAWVYWSCTGDLDGLHVELGILRKNPGGSFGAFAVTGDQGWGGMVQAACTFIEKKLLPQVVKVAPHLAPKLTRVVPVIGQATTAFEAGWTLGREIGSLVIGGQTVDQLMQAFFLKLMGVKG